MVQELPLYSALGLKPTKGGADNKTPSFLVSKSRCRGYAGFGFLLMLAMGGLCYESAAARQMLAPLAKAAARAKRATQEVAHYRLTKLKFEFERHLEHDAGERDLALLARARLARLEREWRTNVTALAARAGAEGCEARVASEVTEDVLRASKTLFAQLARTLALLDTLVERGDAADARHDAMQREILEELQKDAAEGAHFKGLHPDGAAEGDDAAQAALLDAEEWRTELAKRFYERYDAHFASPQTTLRAPDELLADLEKLYEAVEAEADGDDSREEGHAPEPKAKAVAWRDAEATLASWKDRLARVHAAAYVPNAPTTDDALDYAQLHNVLHYVSELRWRARLNGARKALDVVRAAQSSGSISAGGVVAKLEQLEAAGAFPSEWLYVSGVDDLEIMTD
ncbi:hypothetical protein M885DRAFT_503926 [Pelagophyceae sp. CCMP2097]|nr:hypothetical protein M885DRAFT_503926 [Pelagophyceae sp. CCMP2097]